MSHCPQIESEAIIPVIKSTAGTTLILGGLAALSIGAFKFIKEDETQANTALTLAFSGAAAILSGALLLVHGLKTMPPIVCYPATTSWFGQKTTENSEHTRLVMANDR